MREIRAYKAQPVIKSEPVDSVRLTIETEVPEIASIEGSREFHKENAMWVMEALSVLPQGTRHELLIMMLQEKQCLFTIK